MKKIIPVIASLFVLGVATESEALPTSPFNNIAFVRCATSVLKELDNLSALQADIMMQRELVAGASQKEKSAQEKKLKQTEARFKKAQEAVAKIIDCLLAGKFQPNLFAEIRRIINGDIADNPKEATGFLRWWESLPKNLQKAIEDTVNAWTNSGGKDSAELNKYKGQLRKAWTAWRSKPIQSHYAGAGDASSMMAQGPGGHADEPILGATPMGTHGMMGAHGSVREPGAADEVDSMDMDADEAALHGGALVTKERAQKIRDRAARHAANEAHMEASLGEAADMFEEPVEAEEKVQPIYPKEQYDFLSHLFLEQTIDGVKVRYVGLIVEQQGTNYLVRIIGATNAAEVGKYLWVRGDYNINALVGADLLQKRAAGRIPPAFSDKQPRFAPKVVHLVPDNIRNLQREHKLVGKVVAEKNGTAVVGIVLPYSKSGLYAIVDQEDVKKLGKKLEVGTIVGFKGVDSKRVKSYQAVRYDIRYKTIGSVEDISFVGKENAQDRTFDKVVLREGMASFAAAEKRKERAGRRAAGEPEVNLHEGMASFAAAEKREERAGRHAAGEPEVNLRGTFLDEGHADHLKELFGKLAAAVKTEHDKRIQAQVDKDKELFHQVEEKRLQVENALRGTPATPEITATIKKAGGFYQESKKLLEDIFSKGKPWNLGQLRRLGFNLQSTLKHLTQLYADVAGVTASTTAAADQSMAIVPYTGKGHTEAEAARPVHYELAPEAKAWMAAHPARPLPDSVAQKIKEEAAADQSMAIVPYTGKGHTEAEGPAATEEQADEQATKPTLTKSQRQRQARKRRHAARQSAEHAAPSEEQVSKEELKANVAQLNATGMVKGKHFVRRPRRS